MFSTEDEDQHIFLKVINVSEGQQRQQIKAALCPVARYMFIIGDLEEVTSTF